MINYYPIYSNNSASEGYDNFCRVKLLLHHPQRDVKDLKIVDGEHTDSFIVAYQLCRASYKHPIDGLSNLALIDSDVEYSDSEDDFKS